MVARLPMIVFGFFMMAGPAFAGGDDAPPPAEITPPASFRLFDGKRSELYCRLCEAECTPRSGYSDYKIKYVRQWYNYQCRKLKVGAFETRSYSEDENQ